MIGWIAWDEDGIVYKSTFSDLTDVPDTLQIVAVYRDNISRYICTGQITDGLDKWYVFLSDNVVIGDEGLRSEVQARHPVGVIKMGVWATDENYQSIHNQAYTTNWDGSTRNQRTWEEKRFIQLNKNNKE